MICLLCEPEDDDALWLAAALGRRGQHVECVLPEELMVGSALTCRVDSAGVTSTLGLDDGRVLGADTPHLVLNRLVDLPTPTGTSPADLRYLAEEWRAAAAAWLRTLRCPVLNPPRAVTLAGPVLSPPAWRAVAHACDIPVHPWDSDEPPVALDPVEVVCVAGSCADPTGTAPPWVAGSLASMSRRVGAPLLGATFDRADGVWALIDATPHPQLSPGGNELVDAVVACARASLRHP